MFFQPGEIQQISDTLTNVNSSSGLTRDDKCVLFLVRLRLGIPFCAVGVMFGGLSEQTAGDIFGAVLASVTKNFTPKHYGFGHLTRDEVLSLHTPDLAKNLFPKLILVADGTYIYCQKSSHFHTQFITWSSYKHMNLLKFMVWATMDGHIMLADGPYFANGAHDDPKIVEYEFGEYVISFCDMAFTNHLHVFAQH